MLILTEGTVVTGDGQTEPFGGSILIEGNRIAAVEHRAYSGGKSDDVVNLHGQLVMPGAIDIHTHATAPGPRFASGTPGIALEDALGNLRIHLAQGHTTVVDCDGFKLPDDTAQVVRSQPVRVEAATVHFAPMWSAADTVDGSGLQDTHRKMTAREMAESGRAVLIGEVGAGMTLGGGGQDYMYLPAAIKAATGQLVTSGQARALKFAVLGRRAKQGSSDPQELQSLLVEFGLADKLTAAAASEVVEKCVMPSIEIARKGVVESANVANALGLPTLVHTSAPSDEACRAAAEIAGSKMIAGHANHGTFTEDEAIANAEWLKKRGVCIEVDTFDSWGRRELEPRPTILLAMVAHGLVDILATDYAAGHWDGIFEAVEDIWRNGAASLKSAVAMATGNVVRAVPRLGAKRGLLRPGLVADLVVSDAAHPSLVRLVVIDGKVALAHDPEPLTWSTEE